MAAVLSLYIKELAINALVWLHFENGSADFVKRSFWLSVW